MTPSLMSPGAVDWRMKTAHRQSMLQRPDSSNTVPSSSLTDSPIEMEDSWFEYCRTRILASSIPSLQVINSAILKCAGNNHTA